MGPSLRKSALDNANNHLEIYSLVWLDTSVNTTKENLDVQDQLRTLINQFKPFDNVKDCLQYIKNISKENRIILIVSGRLGREILPRIHRLRQVSSIYVYCMDKQKNEKWAQKFSKIKRVIVNLDELVGQIRSDRSRRNICEIDEPFSFNTYSKNSNNEQSTIDSNNQFIHAELLINCLLNLKSDKTDKDQLISLCEEIYKGNQCELSILDEFQQNYVYNKALWWYTRDAFISRLLNKALQSQTIDLLYVFRFLIHDIKNQLELNKCVSPIRAYRGQFLSNDEIQLLKNSIRGFISINSFLSTSLNRCNVVKNLTESDELQRVLFEIDADPELGQIKPFSNIKSFSYTGQEDEILFMVGSIFRIQDIHQQPDGLTIIQMTLCTDNDSELKSIFKSLKSEIKPGETNLLSFGDVLWKMGKLNEAEKYYQRLLNELSNDNQHDISECYFALGNIAMEKDDYNTSYDYHKKSLDIKKEILNENDSSIADSYNSIADIERKKGNRTQALQSYNQALDIWIKVYNNDHPKIAMCLNNIGCIYGEEKNYIKTLECHEKALKIMEKHFSPNHICLGQAHNNIGSVQRYLGNYELALKHYQLSLKIKSKTFSSKHSSIASTYSNIATVYEEINELKQALEYYEKAAAIYRHTLPPTYPENTRIKEDIRRITNKLQS